jgi:branched-chain amino acid transport system ATP-binding protein
MTEIALSASGLNKNFGSLVVAGDVSLALPRGARYALIGPNGAGKTTLINLLTGMLVPDSGKIMLGADDITSVPPDGRVKRGLARTFQINTLFPNLSPLEAVTLAVCERRGEAGVWWKSLPSYKAAAGEAYGILQSLRLGDVCERPTKELAYGQQRLLEIAVALASKPRVLLLDEPAAGVPKEESGELFAAVAGISSDISILFIEHDMDVVFRFASRIIVMVSGSILVEGTPAEISANEKVREVYLGSGHG